jgi:hypothetical protein
MLGFFPLGAYELENPTLAEFKQNAYILGAVTLAGLALSGGKPPSTAAELAAEPTAAFAAASPALHLESQALHASPTALSMLAGAALHRAPTMHAAAAADTAAQALRLNLAHLHLVASASASVDAGAVYTIHLPRALSAASSGSSDVAPIYAVPLPRALFAAAEATISASANITPTPNFVALGVVDLALGQANLRRSALFDAAAQVAVAGDGYLTRAAHMHAAGSTSFAGAVPKINLERWLAAAPAAAFASSGTFGVPATLLASASIELAVTNATEVPKTQVFPPPAEGYTLVWMGDYYKVGTYSVRYDSYILPGEQVLGETPLEAPLVAVQAVGIDQQELVETNRLAVIALPLEEDVTDV